MRDIKFIGLFSVPEVQREHAQFEHHWHTVDRCAELPAAALTGFKSGLTAVPHRLWPNSFAPTDCLAVSILVDCQLDVAFGRLLLRGSDVLNSYVKAR